VFSKALFLQPGEERGFVFCGQNPPSKFLIANIYKGKRILYKKYSIRLMAFVVLDEKRQLMGKRI